MVVVPKWSGGVRDSALPNARLDVRASPDAFGASIGGAVQDAGAVTQRIYLEEKQKALKTRLQDWDGRATQFQLQKREEMRQVRGKSALGLTEKFNGELSSFFGELGKEAADDSQRSALRDLQNDHRAKLLSATEDYTFHEKEAFDKQNFEAAQQSYKDAAFSDYARPEAVEGWAAKIRDSIAERAKTTQQPQALTDLETSTSVSAAYTRAILRQIDNDDDLAAKDAFANWKGNITGNDAARIEGALKESSTRNESRTAADEIVIEATDLETALAELEKRGIKDTEIYDRTKARIVSHFDLKAHAEQQDQSDSFDRSLKAIDNNGGDLTKITPTEWDHLSGRYQAELRARAAQLSKRELPPDNSDTYYDLRSLASAPEMKGDFLKTDLRAVRSQLSERDYRQLIDLQSDLRAGGKKSEEALSGYQTVNEVVKDRLAGAGMDPETYRTVKGKVKANPQTLAFTRQLDAAVSATQNATGKKMTPEDVGKLADRLLIETTISTPRSTTSQVLRDALPFGFLTSGPIETKVRAYEAPGADKLAVSPYQVPGSDRAAIVQRFKARTKRDPSDDEVMGIYNATVAKDANAQ